jgi:hypothetical protein
MLNLPVQVGAALIRAAVENKTFCSLAEEKSAPPALVKLSIWELSYFLNDRM